MCPLHPFGTVLRAALSTSENWVVVSLNTSVTLNLGTTYYIETRAGGGGLFVGIDDAGTYAGGDAFIGTTAQPGKDMAFRVVSSKPSSNTRSITA